MNEHEWLAEQFEANRTHLHSVAFRMLGSTSEADDAVQESWLHLSRADTSDIKNMGGWLTAVVARVCLDMLRARKSRREEPLELTRAPHSEETPGLPVMRVPASLVSPGEGTDPEHEVILADSVGLALLVVLETLAPAERLAFVLHDMFGVPFTEIAPIVGRTPTAARQLASRARRRVQGQGEQHEQRAASTTSGTARTANAKAATLGTVATERTSHEPEADRARRREVVNAFLAASRGGHFSALLAMLDPEVVLRADSAAVLAGAAREVRGAQAVGETFSGRARFAQPALVNGEVGAVWAPGGQPRVVFAFSIADGKIVEINLIADPERLSELDMVALND